jgi:hypothetical protein
VGRDNPNTVAGIVMVVRLLIVLLTLVGAIPVRICTCGAHDHPLFSKHESGERSPLPASDWPSIADDANSPEHHDSDCHFVKPRPLMPPGTPLDTVDVPPLDSTGVALVALPIMVAAIVEPTRDFHPPPNRPLYLTLLVLRN